MENAWLLFVVIKIKCQQLSLTHSLCTNQ